MEDLEEDQLMREKINIYKDAEKISQVKPDNEGEDDEPLMEGPTLEEMLDDFTLNNPEEEEHAYGEEEDNQMEE